MRVVSYHTEDEYSELAEVLEGSLLDLGISYSMDVVGNEPSWLETYLYKPSYILDCLNRYPGEDILYMDVDSILVRKPKILDSARKFFDMAISVDDEGNAISSVMWFKNCEKTKEFLKDWVNNNVNPTKSLSLVLSKWVMEGRIKNLTLPPQYYKINDQMEEISDPVIILSLIHI